MLFPKELAAVAYACVTEGLTRLLSPQRAICDSYGIVFNVITSDQHHWCGPAI